MANFEALLDKLIDDGIIRQGTGYTGVEALYNLRCGMFLVPIQTTLIQKIYAFIVMTFFRGVPFSITRHFFKRTVLTGDQKQIWNLIVQQPLSTAELIRCAELSINKLENDHQVVKKLYETGDGVDYTNIDIHSRLSHTRPGIVQAVTNLYLNKLILFETAN